MRLTPLIALALLPTSLSAQVAPRPTITTSAGIEQVKYPSTALLSAPRFRLAASPVATMGGSRALATDELTTLKEPHFLPDGRIVAFDMVEMRFVVFAVTGKVEKVIGRKGAGPGEFHSMQPLFGVAGDTVIGSDASLAKLVLVRPTQGVVQEIRLTSPLAGWFFSPMGIVNGHVAFLQTEWILPRTDSAFRPRTPLISYDPGAKRTDTLFRIQGPMIIPRTTEKMSGSEVRIFDQGEPLAVTRQGFVVADPARFSLVYRDATGKVIRQVMVSTARRAVTAATRNEWLEAEVARRQGRKNESGGTALVDRKEILANTRFTDSLPAIVQLAPLPDGSVWAIDYEASENSSWGATLINPQGRIVGRLEGKGDAHPLAWARDRVLLASKDDDGIVTWRVFQLLGPR